MMKSHDLTESLATKYLLALTCSMANQTNLILFPTVEHARSAMMELYGSIRNTKNIIRHSKNVIEFDNGSKLFLRAATPTAAKGTSLTFLAIHSSVNNRDFLENILPTANKIIWFF